MQSCRLEEVNREKGRNVGEEAEKKKEKGKLGSIKPVFKRFGLGSFFTDQNCINSYLFVTILQINGLACGLCTRKKASQKPS